MNDDDDDVQCEKLNLYSGKLGNAAVLWKICHVYCVKCLKYT